MRRRGVDRKQAAVHRFSRRRGFTLIELLVVIAIIAILASILFPVFSQAQEAARKTQCLSNCRQMGTAVMMYAQDFDEAIVPWLQPTGLPRDSARRDRNTWVHLLQPYVKNGNPPRIDGLPVNANLPPLGIWRCPSYNVTDQIKSAVSPDCLGPGVIDITDLARQYYAHYAVVAPPPAGPTGSCTQVDPYYWYPGSDPIYTDTTGTLAQIQRPAETALVTEGVTVMTNLPNWIIIVGSGCAAANVHQAGGIHVFADGHSKWLKGNSERYEEQDDRGCWYKKYYTIDH
jgi:prepilin-type N-terminal cleavage/methylation domain-containing protein